MELRLAIEAALYFVPLAIILIASRGSQSEMKQLGLFIAMLPGLNLLLCPLALVDVINRGKRSRGLCTFGHSFALEDTYTNPTQQFKRVGVDTLVCTTCGHRESHKWNTF